MVHQKSHHQNIIISLKTHQLSSLHTKVKNTFVLYFASVPYKYTKFKLDQTKVYQKIQLTVLSLQCYCDLEIQCTSSKLTRNVKSMKLVNMQTFAFAYHTHIPNITIWHGQPDKQSSVDRLRCIFHFYDSQNIYQTHQYICLSLYVNEGIFYCGQGIIDPICFSTLYLVAETYKFSRR